MVMVNPWLTHMDPYGQILYGHFMLKICEILGAYGDGETYFFPANHDWLAEFFSPIFQSSPGPISISHYLIWIIAWCSLSVLRVFKHRTAKLGAKLRPIHLEAAIIWTTGRIFMESHQENLFVPETDWGINNDEQHVGLDRSGIQLSSIQIPEFLFCLPI